MLLCLLLTLEFLPYLKKMYSCSFNLFLFYNGCWIILFKLRQNLYDTLAVLLTGIRTEYDLKIMIVLLRKSGSTHWILSISNLALQHFVKLYF